MTPEQTYSEIKHILKHLLARVIGVRECQILDSEVHNEIRWIMKIYGTPEVKRRKESLPTKNKIGKNTRPAHGKRSHRETNDRASR